MKKEIHQFFRKLYRRLFSEKNENIYNRVLELCYKDHPEERYSDNIFPPPMKAETAMHELITHLLGDDWYVMYPAGPEQIYTEAVYAIECMYHRRSAK